MFVMAIKTSVKESFSLFECLWEIRGEKVPQNAK